MSREAIRRANVRRTFRTYLKRSNGRPIVRRDGTVLVLQKMPCEICGNVDAGPHHPDYSKPFEVLWRCKEHHLAHHRNMVARLGEHYLKTKETNEST